MIRQRTASSTPAQGLKLILSAAAVAATLGGWAALTTATPPAAETSSPPTSLLEQPPIPTLVPLAGARASDTALVAAPALRQVSSPPVTNRPAPVTLTRSSR
jgi:hypothetical protein